MSNAIIFNNQFSQNESSLRVDNPYMNVRYPDKDKAVSGGVMYFGASFLDPEQPQNQRRVYLIQEDGSAIPISQPINLGSGGLPYYNGSPAKIAISGSYSWKVLDKNGEQVYYSPNTTHPTLANLGSMTVKEDRVTLTATQTSVTFDRVDVFLSTINVTGPLVDSRPMFRDVDYTVSDGANGTIFLTSTFPEGTIIAARENEFTGEGEGAQTGIPYSFRTIAEAARAQLPLDGVVIISGGDSYNDGLAFDKYQVVAGGTGANDGINFINMDNGLQLRSLQTRAKFKTYTEALANATLSGGNININLNTGTVFQVTLTESVSSININNAQQGWCTTIALYITQDGTGGRGVSLSGFLSPNGDTPTISTDAGSVTKLLFSTRNGNDWEVYALNDLKVIA